MQTKFNIGDKVKILDGSDIDGYRGHWTPRMNSLVGRIVIIDEIRISDKGIGYLTEEIPYMFDERGLAFISSEPTEPTEPIEDDLDDLDKDDSLLFLAAVLAGLL
jgi:hypothetical protein|nr:MAG TPA: mindbomb E3 ubiquitin protein ligase [Caudoviricetes sp.]